jgi:hypothetical protein
MTTLQPLDSFMRLNNILDSVKVRFRWSLWRVARNPGTLQRRSRSTFLAQPFNGEFMAMAIGLL